MNAIKRGKTINLYNFGKHTRDFTYIDDVVEIHLKFSKLKTSFENGIYNICSSNPVNL